MMIIYLLYTYFSVNVGHEVFTTICLCYGSTRKGKIILLTGRPLTVKLESMTISTSSSTKLPPAVEVLSSHEMTESVAITPAESRANFFILIGD